MSPNTAAQALPVSAAREGTRATALRESPGHWARLASPRGGGGGGGVGGELRCDWSAPAGGAGWRREREAGTQPEGGVRCCWCRSFSINKEPDWLDGFSSLLPARFPSLSFGRICRRATNSQEAEEPGSICG